MSKITAAAILGVLLLAAVIVQVARSSADGTPAGSVLVVPATIATDDPVPIPQPACVLAGPAGDADPDQAVVVSGACEGSLSGTFTCVEGDETQYLSTARPLEERGKLVVTIVVPDYDGPGRYPESAVYAQVSGTEVAPRWANRKVPLRVDQDGSVDLHGAVIAPEPGTPAEGDITLTGQARCQ